VTAATVREAGRLALVARAGVGYDAIDVDALTERGIFLTITPDGVRRSMGAAALTLLLALGHRLVLRDRFTRGGRWVEESQELGVGLTGRTLGLIGLGNIGRELLALARPLGMRHLAADPYVEPAVALAHGAELVELERLLAEADFVCITCALSDQTRRLIDADKLALMKPTAYLVNVARGPIVDQRALTEALMTRAIAGAGLDVFEQEPIDPADPLLELENVILAPHAIGHTDQWALETGRSACAAILDVANGRLPRHVVNREVLEHPLLRNKLRAYSRRLGEPAGSRRAPARE
jgi:D-3-phosphoglycerate dehydrogenase